MPVSAGSAALPIVPQLSKDFSKQLLSQMAGPATKAAERTGKESGQRFGKAAERTGKESGHRLGRRFSGGLRAGIGPVSGILRGFGPSLAAAFGVGAIIAGLKSVTDEARESAVVGKQTAAVLKATGGAARVSATQIGDLATALSNKAGVDDEAIQSAENLLLTFKGVRNETGRGNDVFNQASSAIVDMTAAMNGGKVTQEGLKASTIQVGKALNDPIKGITALTRVGVTFTEQQKKQIAAMVKAGDTAGAQKIILAELRSEFGGAAAASADAGQRLGVVWGNIKEQVGTALLPILNRLFGFLADKLPGALKTVSGWFHTAVLGVSALRAAFAEGDVTSTGFVGVMERLGVAARAVADWFATKVLPVVRTLLPFLREMATNVGGALVKAFQSMLPGLRSIIDGMQRLWPIVQVGLKIWAAYLYILWSKIIPVLLRIAGPVLGALFKALGLTVTWLANMIRWISLGITWLARLATGTKTTADAFETAGKRIRTTWTTTRDVIGAVVSFILKLLRGWMDMQFTVVANILRVMGKLPGPMGAPFRKAEEAVRKAKTTIDGQMDKIQEKIDKLRGKDVKVKVTGAWDPPAGFTTKTLIQMSTPGGRGGLATGGRIPGFGGGDIFPAMLEPGEAVVDKDRTRKYSWFFSSIGVPGFQRGGLVGTTDRVGDVATAAMGGLRDATTRSMTRVMRDALVNTMKRALEGFGGPGIAKALGWARGQVGKPYIWGGVGPGGFDCSGFMSAITNVIMGRSPYHRLFATGSFPTSGWAHGFAPAGFSIGSRRGRPGHMAGTLGGVNVESRGSRGVVVGPGARGATSSLFGGNIWHLAGHSGSNGGRELLPARIFDHGGAFDPGWTLAYNGTGKPEPVGFDYDKLASALAKGQTGPAGRQPIQLVLRDGRVLADLVTYEQHRANR